MHKDLNSVNSNMHTPQANLGKAEGDDSHWTNIRIGETSLKNKQVLEKFCFYYHKEHNFFLQL